MAKGAAIINRRLAALRTPSPGQERAAVLAMDQRWTLSIFAAKEATLSRLFDAGDGGVAQNNFRRFVGHVSPSL